MRVYPIRHGESEANRLRVMAYRGHGHGGWFKVRLPQAEAA